MSYAYERDHPGYETGGRVRALMQRYREWLKRQVNTDRCLVCGKPANYPYCPTECAGLAWRTPWNRRHA